MLNKNYIFASIIVSVTLLPAIALAQPQIQGAPQTQPQNQLQPKHKPLLPPGSRVESDDQKLLQNKTSATGTKNVSDPAALLCAQKAMTKREDAIISAFNVYSQAVISALNARKVALNQTWTKTTPKERNTARNLAWETYKKSVNEANAKLKSARKEAHNVFSNETKTCKMPVPGEDQRADLI